MHSLQTSLLQSIINQIAEPALIVLANAPHYTIVARNDSHRLIATKGSDEVLGHNLIDAFNPEDLGFPCFSILLNAFSTCIKTGLEINLPAGCISDSDDLFPERSICAWELQLRPLLNPGGGVDYLLGTRINYDTVSHIAQEIKEYSSPELNLTQAENINFVSMYARLEAENKTLRASNMGLRNLNLDLQLSHLTYQKTDKNLENTVITNGVRSAFNLETDNTRNRLTDFFMQAPAGICILDGPELVFELVNPRFQAIFSTRDLLGKVALTALPELLGNPIWEIVQQVYLTGKTLESKELHIPLAKFTGGPLESRFFNIIYQARRNDLNKIDGLIIFGFEVTEMVTAKKEIEQSEKRFRVVLDALPHIAWTSNADGGINFVNQRWYDYTGLDFEKNKNNLWALTLHADDLAGVIEQVTVFMSEVRMGEVEFRKKRKDGIYRWHLARMQPVLNNTGNLLFWVGTSTDIEDLKWLQQQKDDFVNIASHELKTPLTSLQISLQLLEQRMPQLSPALIKTLISKASGSINKVVNLVDDLLNAGKLSQGELELSKSWFSAASLVSKYGKNLSQAGKHSILFTGNTDSLLFGDAGHIEQVFTNIFNNAIKYAPASEIILVAISHIDDFVKVSISDKGPGITEDLIPHLFDRYYQVENRGFQNTGLGLGLYICAEIVRKHGGQISVESKLNKGTTISFTLPGTK